MILYLDASALVKRYIEEPGTPEVEEAIAMEKRGFIVINHKNFSIETEFFRKTRFLLSQKILDIPNTNAIIYAD